MDPVVLKWQILHGSLVRRLLIRGILFTLAMVVFPFIQNIDDARAAEPLATTYTYNDCQVHPSSHSLASTVPCKESENLTMVVFRELMSKKLLDSSGKALCVGEGSKSAISALLDLGFSDAIGVERHPFFSFVHRRFVYKLNFKDSSFDFVFSRALDKVSVPALFILEAERVLRPGGIGAMLVGSHDFNPGSLIRSATPVSSFLKSSNIVQVCGIGGSFTLVVFRKKFDIVDLFQAYHLPDACPSIENNHPFLQFLEPLLEHTLTSPKDNPRVSYLSNFFNVSSRNKFVYINIGAKEHLNFLYPSIKPQVPFNVYIIDNDPFVLSFYKNPGFTFVYHPGLARGKASDSFDLEGDWGMFPDEDDFDFVSWLRKTVGGNDFVVLAMNAGVAELKVLFELFESGAICEIDEVFLRCRDGTDCRNSMCGDCLGLFRSLRNSGVFVHQWIITESI